DLIKLAQLDAIDGFFLKVPKAGGIHKSKKFVAVAEALGLNVMTGCMINSGLGAAVEAHFLCSTEWLGRIEQESIGPLNMHDLLETDGGPIKNDLGLGSPRYEKGYLYPPEGIGLGVELNEAVIPGLKTEGRAPIVVTL
ncbi:MAG: mandelate racemase, partial [Deltaproteobacteria bacterium]|nr:mandelate racemase [Deltaproteobacteria bacterium]